MARPNKLNKIEIMFLVYGLLTIFAGVVGVGYSLVFLSGQMLHAFSTEGNKIESAVKFDIDGFKKLGL
ncbi:MAG: hypothetical protein A3B23_00825 [Candidatus Colwellbacteria bacterium RIFCSPLOWO2_01_FULL_48_10]|uniref:Uncharacterized protein n=2 Tax=Bacteria candidate phyla TaxID=1783234 RepID=A0A1F5P4A6_9BACT|nr:MAG: hypothetical protein A2846_04145 [Candidatus Doudnabacteria bacterium RIFCSPHIGHO2_01_FULL_49_9]OGY59492.1 MAG: hypothetical protein A3B23_00825 [Candidatus Colwellbacteria bacterium RIFCSPLOWO2_01_FULL_48_10]